MTTLEDILTPTIAQCSCPECGSRWMGEIASGIVGELTGPDGAVSVWCDSCQSKPRKVTGLSLKPSKAELWASMCPEEYRLTSEGGKTDRERLKRAHGQRNDGEHLAAGQISQLVFNRQPVLLAGEPGTMKTRLAWRMVKMVWDTTPKVRCFTSWRFQADLQDASGGYGAGKWMSDLIAAELVFVDDLGKAEWTANTHGAFFELLEARINQRRALLITTNESFATLQEARAEHKSAVAKSSANPIIRRFREFATTIVMQKPT